MFEFTLKSTKDVKRINIEFGDDSSEVVVNNPPAFELPETNEPANVSDPAPQDPVEVKAPRQRAAKAPAFDPFARAASKTNYGVTAKPKATAVDPEPVEELDDRPDKVDLDFGNSSF